MRGHRRPKIFASGTTSHINDRVTDQTHAGRWRGRHRLADEVRAGGCGAEPNVLIRQ